MLSTIKGCSRLLKDALDYEGMLSTIKGCSRLLKDAFDYEGMLSTIKGCFRLSRMLSTEYGKKNCDVVGGSPQ